MKKGFTIIELLIAIVIAIIIVGAIVSLYISSNRIFMKTKPISDAMEEMRSAVATLEFIFSRWGVAVPCANNRCSFSNPPSDCTSYPPSDPMCITIAGNEAIFYASLHGMGFVVSVDTDNGKANLLSCRLNDSNSQNCYYVWVGDRIVKTDITGVPVIHEISGLSQSNADCLSEPNTPNTTADIVMLDKTGGDNHVTLSEGMVITRVPHRIRLYVSDGWLVMDQEDMASMCGLNEPSLKIAKVKNFSIEKYGRGVKVDMTFVSQSEPEQTFRLVRYFGR